MIYLSTLEMKTPDSNPWDELVLEVVRAARKRLSIIDFEMQCRLAPVSNGKSYLDRMRVAEKLIADRIIEKDNGYLRIAMKDAPEWLLNGLKTGSETSWEILENIDPTHKLSQKIDRLLLEQIGLDGELAVMEALSKKLPDDVLNRLRHISLNDDPAGYDIQSPSTHDSSNTVLLEVKTTSRAGIGFNFFISRNETRIASQNENWRLLGVARKPHGFEIIGTVQFGSFSQYLPIDAPFDGNSGGRWESAHITIPLSIFTAGLP